MFYYVLKFKHWKQQRIHQDIEKKLKRYPIVQAAWEKAEAKQYNIPGLTETRMVVPETGENEVCQWMTPQGLAFSQYFVFISAYAMTISIILLFMYWIEKQDSRSNC